jgi:hypothetical protein
MTSEGDEKPGTVSVVAYVLRWPWMVWAAGINCGILLSTVQTWHSTGSGSDFWHALPAVLVMMFLATRARYQL